MQQQDEPSVRWRQRSIVAAVVRFGVLCAPVAASVSAAWTVHRLLPPAVGLADRAWHLVALVAVSTAVLPVADRLGRRLLPLATLLDLSMLFPDRAPSRMRVAREAIRRRPIEEQLERVRHAGADPGAVAREILTLVAALSAHDRPTRGHAERVRMFTDLLAEQMRIPRRDRDLLRWAAILHDIGKLEVPATLLNKPGKPTADEWAVLKAHPAHGAALAAGLLPWLGEWADVIVQHHERYDGTGYPSGLSGAGISLGARIVSVADAYDVMTAARAYQRPVSRTAALRELVRFSHTQFDPVVVRAMVAVGAPRLRRAQGVLAWLADIPIVASGTVPAATVARAVGAGALATGAVAAGGAPPVGPPTPTPVVTAIAHPVQPTETASTPGWTTDRADAVPTLPARRVATATTPAPGHPDGGAATPPGSGGGVGGPGTLPTLPTTTGVDAVVGSVVTTGSDAVRGAVDSVSAVVSAPIKTVSGVVSAPVTSVSGLVPAPGSGAAVKEATGTGKGALGSLTGH